MLSTQPCAQIGSAFSNQLEGQGRSKPVDLCQVEPKNTKECSADIERRRANLLCLGPGFGQLAGVMLLFGGQNIQHGFKVAITFKHLGLIEVVEVQRLRKGEDMLGPIIAV